VIHASDAFKLTEQLIDALNNHFHTFETQACKAVHGHQAIVQAQFAIADLRQPDITLDSTKLKKSRPGAAFKEISCGSAIAVMVNAPRKCSTANGAPGGRLV